MAQAQKLPPKEQSLFKNVVRLYETKSFKKAVKTADQILKKFPEHGETLAMKGLTVNQMDRKAEAHELVRLGLRKDMRSHICWHVYGLLYRSDHGYHEAARAYLNALRLDPDNQQILRDLALLQIQIRDYDGFEESRRKLLHLRPNQRMNWIGVAVSFHLQKNYSTALEVVKTYLKTLDESAVSGQDPFERSELLLYNISIMEEAGEYEMALKQIAEDSSNLLDTLGVREMRVRILRKLSRNDEAVEELRSLIAVNPNNHAYHRDLHAASASAISSDPAAVIAKSLSLCDEVAESHPYSRAASRIALDLVPSGDHPEFLPRADRYIRPFLRRGVPSLFSDIKALYADETKVRALGSLFETYRDGMQASPPALPALLPFPGKAGNDASEDASEESLSVLLWIYHYLAQHFDRVGQSERGLTEIDAAIEHTPTMIECHMVKARILKHCGDTINALAVADEARKMDLSDRFVNTKCTKYALRADNVPQAESWISLFTRDGDSGGVQALYDMQCIWYELEAAESHLRCGQLALALKKFMAVERHCADMIEDQFDFHTYCLRKVTLRSYVEMLRMEDKLQSHHYFQRAATGVVRCLLRFEGMSADERAVWAGGVSDIAGYADMTDAERKKAMSKKKKRDAKKRNKQQAGDDLKTNGKSAGEKNGDKKGNDGGEVIKANGADEKAGKKDKMSANEKKSSAAERAKNPGWMETDPDGAEHVKGLLSEENKDLQLLPEASNRIKLLQQFDGDEIETQILAFDVAIRKGKLLSALRAARRARAIDEEAPETIAVCIRLVYELDSKGGRQSLSEEATEVFKRLGGVLNGKTIVETLDAYIARHKDNVSKSLRVGEVLIWAALADISGAKSVDKSLQFMVEVIASMDPESRAKGFVSASDCGLFLRRLEGMQPRLAASSIETVRSALKAKFPRASIFAEPVVRGASTSSV